MLTIFKILSKLIASFLLALVLLLAWGWFNSPISPVAWTADPNPGLAGKFVANGRLDSLQYFGGKLGAGPEDTAFNIDGSIYTGIASGEIFRIDLVTGLASLFVNTQGRPLGLEFDQAGNLIVADAKLGLLQVAPSGSIETLVDAQTVLFADDVDIAQDGTIWFSNASQRYGYADALNSFMEGDTSGQIYSFAPSTGKLTLQMEGLFFANGVTLGPEDEYLLVSETGHGRIHRLWLRGPKQGQRDIFASGFPGNTDNISYNGRDTVWVALPALRETQIAGMPALRRILSGLPKDWWLPNNKLGMVVGLNLQGEVSHNLQLSTHGGKVPFSDITSVNELNGKLYLGSIVGGHLAVVNLP